MNSEYMTTLALHHPFLHVLSIHIYDDSHTLDESVLHTVFPHLGVLVFVSKGSRGTKQCREKGGPDHPITTMATNPACDWAPRLRVVDIGSLNERDTPIVAKILRGHRFGHPFCIVNRRDCSSVD